MMDALSATIPVNYTILDPAVQEWHINGNVKGKVSDS